MYGLDLSGFGWGVVLGLGRVGFVLVLGCGFWVMGYGLPTVQVSFQVWFWRWFVEHFFNHPLYFIPSSWIPILEYRFSGFGYDGGYSGYWYDGFRFGRGYEPSFSS